MATKRKGLSKATRFEVFKRDRFACQYCGKAAPEAALVVDHIQPVAGGGGNDMMNLITACDACNAGKAARLLSDGSAVSKQRAELDRLAERREQIEMMVRWRESLADLSTQEVDALAAAWSKALRGRFELNDSGRKKARALIKKFGLAECLEAVDVAAERYLDFTDEGAPARESVDLAWSKVGGILAIRALPETERRLRYIRGILQRRLRYIPRDALDCLQDLHSGSDADLDQMEQAAKTCTSWTRFFDEFYD